MEYNYCFIPDNISEIILITYHMKIAFDISTCNKNLFVNFYHIPKFVRNCVSWEYPQLNITKFVNLKELTYHNYFTTIYSSYNFKQDCKDLMKLTLLHYLKIKGKINDAEYVDLSNFKNLTSLYFVWNKENKKIKFNHSNIRKLTNTICEKDKHSYFFNLCNPEELHLKMNTCEHHVLKNHINSKLTNLTVRFMKQYHHVYLSQIHCDNLVELCVEYGQIRYEIPYQKIILPCLTSLKMIRCAEVNLINMTRLKSLIFKDHSNLCVGSFTGVNTVTYLCFDNIKNLRICNTKFDTSYLSKFGSLQRFEMKKCKNPQGLIPLREYCFKNKIEFEYT